MCGGFAAGALAAFAVNSSAAIYKRMLPLRSDFQICFRLKQLADEECESVTS